MKQSELMQLLTNMQRQIEDLDERVKRLENPVTSLDDDDGDSGGGPGFPK